MVEYEVYLYPRAYRDIEGIYEYITTELLVPEIAQKQTERLWNAIESLRFMPSAHQDRLTGRFVGKGYKQLLVDNYIVIFKIEEQKHIVYVITIQYYKRDV